MLTIHAADQLGARGHNACLAIGVFDGVHLGHQQIIRQTIGDARRHGGPAVVLTFDCHPNSVVAPDRVPPLIYSPPQKLRAIESLGADALLLVHFDRAFSLQPADSFIRNLNRDLRGLKSLCVGADFEFGHRRGGNVTLLKELGRELGFAVHGLTAVSLDGQVVSSTRIREAVRAGDLDLASQLLGRPYAIAGQVIEGDRLGRRLGFPTANLDLPNLLLPPNGVYTGLARLENRYNRAVLNIGFRPTLKSASPALRVEAHLLDFAGDLYGKELEIEVGEKLRDEMRFTSLEELKAQISRDVAAASGSSS